MGVRKQCRFSQRIIEGEVRSGVKLADIRRFLDAKGVQISGAVTEHLESADQLLSLELERNVRRRGMTSEMEYDRIGRGSSATSVS